MLEPRMLEQKYGPVLPSIGFPVSGSSRVYTLGAPHRHFFGEGLAMFFATLFTYPHTHTHMLPHPLFTQTHTHTHLQCRHSKVDGRMWTIN